jgi:hypothetical protein
MTQDELPPDVVHAAPPVWSSSTIARRYRQNAAALWFACFALLVSYEYVLGTPVRSATAAPEPHGDGHYYYEYLRSLVFDGNFDVTNEHALMGDPFGTGFSPITKKGQNVFSIGPALFWLPFTPAAYAVQKLSNSSEAAGRPVDGTELPFQRTVLFGSVFAGLLATALGIRIAMRFTTSAPAVAAGIGVCLSSPLIWYMLRQSSYSHAVDAAVASVFVATWLARYGSRSRWHWAGLGALLGFSMLIRPQNALHAIFPLWEWSVVALGLLRGGNRKSLLSWCGNGCLFVGAALLVFVPMLVIWRNMLGYWTLTPQGDHFMDWGNSRWDAALFASRSGLYAWHPLLLLATSGLFILAFTRRHASELRLFAALSILELALQAYVNGAARDWWGGWAFGGRRFVACSLYFMVGLAALLDFARGLAVRHPNRTAQLAGVLVLGVFVLHNRSLMEDYVASRAPPDQPQAMKPHYEAAATKTLGEGYALLGNPGSWPANLWFALQADTSPERYDIAAASDLHEDLNGHWRNFCDDVHAMGGFEAPAEWGGRCCRLTRQRNAHWVLTLRSAALVTGIITLASSHAGTRVRMRSAGAWFFDHELTTGFADYPIELPRASTGAGIVYVDVEQTFPTADAVVAWDKAILKVLPTP